MAEIRPFQNRDTYQLAIAWQQHWECVGLPVAVTSSQLEQTILDKLFFDYAHMLVIENEGQVVGFTHIQTDPSNDPPIRARIASFCIGQTSDREQIGRTLLQHAMEHCRQQGIREFEAGTVLGDLSGLVGLEPFAGVIGMIEHDQMVVQLLTDAGLEPRQSMLAYELQLSSFRPSIDRELLMLRRTAKIEEHECSLPSDWRAACAHSHFDITKFLVVNRTGSEIAHATYYLADPEAMVMDRGLLYLAGFDSVNAQEAMEDIDPETRFAVVGSLPTLVEHHFSTVRAIIDSRAASAGARISFLEQLGFRKVAAGAAYSCQL